MGWEELIARAWALVRGRVHGGNASVGRRFRLHSSSQLGVASSERDAVGAVRASWRRHGRGQWGSRPCRGDKEGDKTASVVLMSDASKKDGGCFVRPANGWRGYDSAKGAIELDGTSARDQVTTARPYWDAGG